MDIQPQSTQPISDDQELAKVLAGIGGADDVVTAPNPTVSVPVPSTPPPAAPADEPALPVSDPAPLSPPPAVQPLSPTGDDSLDIVKKEAINELRPLVDKLTLAPEEKFDTYLLLIRSTDDRTLIAPAHEAAKLIADEARRAQALLDIIKEIDFLSGAQA